MLYYYILDINSSIEMEWVDVRFKMRIRLFGLFIFVLWLCLSCICFAVDGVKLNSASFTAMSVGAANVQNVERANDGAYGSYAVCTQATNYAIFCLNKSYGICDAKIRLASGEPQHVTVVLRFYQSYDQMMAALSGTGGDYRNQTANHNITADPAIDYAVWSDPTHVGSAQYLVFEIRKDASKAQVHFYEFELYRRFETSDTYGQWFIDVQKGTDIPYLQTTEYPCYFGGGFPDGNHITLSDTSVLSYTTDSHDNGVGNMTDYLVFHPKKLGTCSITIKRDSSRYYTSATYTVQLTVVPRAINHAQIEHVLSQTSYTYDGTAKNPGITVTDKYQDPFEGINHNLTLVKGTDYTVAYQNNTDAGTASVIVTGIGNYQSSKTTTFVIQPKALTIGSYTADNKVYDGTTTATGTITLSGIVSGDTVIPGGTQNFANRNVANGITVTLSKVTLAGADAGNYTMDSSLSAMSSANITPVSLTVRVLKGEDKIYDGTTNAVVSAYSENIYIYGLVGAESVGCGITSAFFDTKNVGNNKTVTVNLYWGSGTGNISNYTYPSVATTTASILPATLTVTASTQTITYGSTIAAGAGQVTVTGLVSGDSLSAVTLTASRASAGTGYITPSDAVIKDSASLVMTGNYTISYVNGTLTVNRASVDKPLTVGCTYNGKEQYGVKPTVGVGFSYSGTIKATDAGAYSATATLDSNHQWSDGTIADVTIPWSIAKLFVTPTLTANDRLYNGTVKADGELTLSPVVAGDDVSASYTACDFNSPLVGQRTAVATGIALKGASAKNYTLSATTATDDAYITKNTLDVYIVSDRVNDAQETLMKGETKQAATQKGISLPAVYTVTNATGAFGAIANEIYERQGVYVNALGITEDTLASELVMDGVDCVSVTYYITTGQNAVYGDNSTEAGESTRITTYANGAWEISDKARSIATNVPAEASLNVYLREGEHLLVDTDIGMYYGRVEVTVTKDSTTYATDKIDAFFPVENYRDDYRVSKLDAATNDSYNEARGDYWSNIEPFIAEETGVYTFTFTVTGSSYLLDTLHGLGLQYGKDPGNAPANAPITTIRKITIGGTEIYGIDA